MSEENKDIGYRQWGLSAPRAVLLLVHGLGAHGGRWEALAEFFQKKGVSSYAIELTNPADRASGAKGHFKKYRDSVLRLYDIAAANHPGIKIFLTGESMGALLAFLIVSERPALFDGLIFISPAFANKVRLAPLDYVKIFLSLFYDQKKLFKLPFDSSMCTRDNHYRHKMEQDTLEYRHAPSRLLVEVLLAQARAGMVKNAVRIPTLFLIAGDDKIADSRAAAKVFSALPAQDKALVEFQGMYHSLSVELGREAVFEEMLKWIDKRI
jgi:acylglycerol lipase